MLASALCPCGRKQDGDIRTGGSLPHGVRKTDDSNPDEYPSGRVRAVLYLGQSNK